MWSQHQVGIWYEGPALEGNFQTFRFCEFQKSLIFEAWKFNGNNQNFQTRKIFARKNLEKSLVKVQKKFGTQGLIWYNQMKTKNNCFSSLFLINVV